MFFCKLVMRHAVHVSVKKNGTVSGTINPQEDQLGDVDVIVFFLHPFLTLILPVP